MFGYDFKIQYKPRCKNTAADALSRHPNLEKEVWAVSTVQPMGLKGIAKEITKDEKLQRIIHDLLVDSNAHIGYKYKKDKLLYKKIIVLAMNSTFIPKFLAKFYFSPYGGYLGFIRTYKQIT